MLTIVKNLGLVLLFVTFSQVRAEETVTPTGTSTVTAPSWNDSIQKKYNLTNEQMKLLTDSQLPEPQLAMAAQLAKTSNKSLEEILKMRAESKNGWGKIAKELGVNPKELGQAVSELKRARNEERKKLKDEKREHHDMKSRDEKKARHEKKEKADRPVKKDK